MPSISYHFYCMYTSSTAVVVVFYLLTFVSIATYKSVTEWNLYLLYVVSIDTYQSVSVWNLYLLYVVTVWCNKLLTIMTIICRTFLAVVTVRDLFSCHWTVLRGMPLFICGAMLILFVMTIIIPCTRLLVLPGSQKTVWEIALV